MQNEKALRGYRKARDPEGLAKIKEKMGDYDGAIRLLKKHHRITDALRYAAKYEVRRNVRISPCYRVHYMASEYAEKLAKPTVQNSQTELTQFEEVLRYLQPTKQVPFYKAAEMHERACEVLKKEHKYDDLYRIYKAQGWFDEGIQLARRRDKEDFILFKATAELADTPGKLQDSTVVLLKKLLDPRSETGAKTHLIYGNALQDNTMIKAARDYYSNKKNQNILGQIEAFQISTTRAKYDDASQRWINIHLDRNDDLLTLALDVCKEIRHVIAAIDPTREPSPDHQLVISQIEKFYGIDRQKVGEELHEMYFVPASSYPWTNQLLTELKIKRFTDSDGMLQLEVEEVLSGVCTHLEGYVKKWIVEDELKLVKHFHASFTAHPLHHEIAAGGYLHGLCTFQSSKQVKSQQEYFQMLCNAFDLAHYGNQKAGSKSTLFKAIVDTISPQATCYFPTIPTQIKSESLIQMLNEKVSDVLAKNDQDFNFNNWIEAWRMKCVSRKGLHKMKEILHKRSEKFNKKPGREIDSGGFQRISRHQRSHDTHQHIPPVYVLDRNDNYQHLISLWIRTCELMCHEKQGSLASCTIAVYNILRQIASQKSIWNTVSVSNLLNIVTMNTTAILTMSAACSTRFQLKGDIYLPDSYKNVVAVFHNMNGSLNNMDLYRSWISYIMHRKNLPEVPSKLEKMLTIILKIMIGMYNKEFNPLKYALSREECLKNGEAHHCLVFVFTLFCNIALIRFNPSVFQEYRLQIYESIKYCKEHSLTNAYCQFLNSRTLLGCFGAVRELLQTSKDNLLHVHLSFDHRLSDIEIQFSPAFLNNNPLVQSIQLLPFPVHLTPQQSKTVVMRSALRAEAQPFHPAESSSTPGDSQVLNEVSPTTPAILLEDENPPELLTMDSIEADEDDPETCAALNIESDRITAPVDEESGIVDYSFCLVCGSSVADSTSPETPEKLYGIHCHTEEHITNSGLKKRFDDEEEGYFNPRKEELLLLQSKCAPLRNYRQDDELQHTIDEITTNVKRMEEYIQMIRNSGEWKEGLYSLQNDFSSSLQSLSMTAKRLIEDTEKMKRDIEREKKQQERKNEEEVIEDEQPEEDEDIVEINCGEKEKKKSRQRKRTRRRK